MSLNNGEGLPIVIRSNRLAVEVAAPGTVYNRTRFDWTGFITQVTLDGNHTFCVPEDYRPDSGSGGIGLCNEFGIDMPINYEATKPGESFPKLGIGLLIRPDDQPYNFFRAYEIAQRYPIHVESSDSQARFVVDPMDCRGYAARLIKTLSVEENRLQVAYHLENTGSRPIVTNEYCHNFVGIDRQPVGPEYTMRFPQPVTFGEPPQDVFEVDGQQVRWKFPPVKQFYCRPQQFSKTDQPQWELTHAPTGVNMREYVDFAPDRVAMWGAPHVISAEIFVGINLAPGQSQSWTRRFEFFD